MKRDYYEQLTNEFDCQVETLMHKQYPRAAGVKAEEFLKHIQPLKGRIRKIALSIRDGRVPFVIVVKNDWVAAEKAMRLVERNGKQGFIGMYPVKPRSFKPLESLVIPNALAYLMVDIDTGQETLNVTPDEALKVIKKEHRSPLTIDEGIALVTHYPGTVKTNSGFSLLGSRCGDRRVTALWISAGKPRLGWCWAGNPHTWLGSASCRQRIGS